MLHPHLTSLALKYRKREIWKRRREPLREWVRLMTKKVHDSAS